MDNQPHFIAQLTYLSIEEGGRRTPAASGYRPAIKFPFFTDQYFTGMQNFIGADMVFPGDIISAEITLISIELLKDKIYEGLSFDFYEGEKLIGHGVITKLQRDNYHS